MEINVPSFGEWGFIIGIKEKINKSKLKARIAKNFNEKYTRYLTREKALSLLEMDKGFSCEGILPNTLINPVILRYYDDKMWELL
jgi:spermidine synthase